MDRTAEIDTPAHCDFDKIEICIQGLLHHLEIRIRAERAVMPQERLPWMLSSSPASGRGQRDWRRCAFPRVRIQKWLQTLPLFTHRPEPHPGLTASPEAGVGRMSPGPRDLRAKGGEVELQILVSSFCLHAIPDELHVLSSRSRLGSSERTYT